MGINMSNSTDPPGLAIDPVLDSPAYKAGLRSGDVILALDGKELGADVATYNQQLQDALKSKHVGDSLAVKVFRPGPQLIVTVNGVEYPTEFPLEDYPDILAHSKPGDVVKLEAINESRTLEFTVILGPRPEGGAGTIPPNEQLWNTLCANANETTSPYPMTDAEINLRYLAQILTSASGTQTQFDDLFVRLNNRASPDDGFRSHLVSLILRDGFTMDRCIKLVEADLKSCGLKTIWGFDGIHSTASWMLKNDAATSWMAQMPVNITIDNYTTYWENRFKEAAELVSEAFSALSDEEKAFVAEHRAGLADAFAADNYINEDADKRRFRDNAKLIAISRKIEYSKLLAAQAKLLVFQEPYYLDELKSNLKRIYAGKLDQPVLYEKETPFGWIVIQGTGRTWRNLPTDPAQYRHDLLVIDLGGDDFYSTTAGSGISPRHPVGVLIDFGGDDAYESTLPYSQGSGSLGCGLLVDLEGDDSYIGMNWAQGTGFFGCGALVDAAGNDSYRGQAFCQAASIFGTGILYDVSGDDRCEAHLKSQAFAGAKAVSFLVDGAGDDYRYAKGVNPTNYGDPGIFDSWSQGCADGFRQYASGGIAGVIDLGGDDYCEAGNFSQGGGYYFGLGFYYDEGGNDHFVGSRYNQGFSAHQAVGVFLNYGGDDLYQTRQGVAQGLAWDECVTYFYDSFGDDRYEGGTGFSQGASAHNSLCIFRDGGGRDIYDYPPGQARAGGNDYHGGSSLSMFIDEGGDVDSYNWDVAASIAAGAAASESGESEVAESAAPARTNANNLITVWKEYGFFCDLPGSIAEILEADAWKGIWVEQGFEN
jgi:hypothetical protein